MRASPAKLKSGEWGARVYSAHVSKGAQIQITAKSGKSWSATVSHVIWRGDGVALVATESKPRYYRRRQSGDRSFVVDGFEFCGHPCPVSGRPCGPKYGPCHDCE